MTMNTDIDIQKKPLILVADDDITVRIFARECLEEAGFAIAEAENGLDAVERAAALRPDAVLLDVLMPELDGYGACRKIRDLIGNEHLPILMMTSLDDVESIHAAFDAGASEFTAKPINWTIESHRLHNMLRAAEAAKQVYISKQEWERTFNALDEVVTILDPNLNILQANEAARAACRNPLDSVLGMQFCDAFCVAGGEKHACPIEAVLRTGEKHIIELENECLEGTFIHSIFPIFDDAGALSRIVHMAKDITERQQLEVEVRRAQKMEAVGTLAGGLAHDFNNLLQVIMGYSELVERGFGEQDKGFQYMQEVKNAAFRGSEISRQLLTIGRKTESKLQETALNEVVKDVFKLLSRTIPKMVSMEHDLGGDLSAVNADPVQLEQVLMNLAVNANHAMPEGGTLRFETRNTALSRDYCRRHPGIEPGEYVRISVTDTGCGMNEEVRSRIFEPFFTTRAPDKGTGLGLAMVYGIVKNHDGQLVCSSREGEGTTFKIYLPVFKGVAGTDKKEITEIPVAGGDELILVVDDDPKIRHLHKKILVRAGYHVMLATDGRHALEVYESGKDHIDCVLLDLNMPVMGGMECLKKLQQEHPGVKVLLASGFALNEEDHARLGDTVHYLGKPYHDKQLLIKIRAILDGVRELAA